MNRRVWLGVRTVAMALAGAALMLPSPAAAQWTTVLEVPVIDMADTTIRGGAFADTNYAFEPLVTRDSEDPSYVRRALLKFDTENRVPYRAQIESAKLTLTV